MCRIVEVKQINVLKNSETLKASRDILQELKSILKTSQAKIKSAKKEIVNV